MSSKVKVYQNIIRREIAQKLKRNPRLSLRALAKTMDINHGALSQILNGKRVPSLKTAHRIVNGLGINSEDSLRFFASLAQTQRSRGLERLSPAFCKGNLEHEIVLADQQIHSLIGEWYHLAILEATYLPGFQADPVWISKKLNISQTQARIALDELLDYGLLVSEAGGCVKRDPYLTIDTNTTSVKKKELQTQILSKAIESLERDHIDTRCMKAATFAIDPEKLPIAREMIDSFLQSMCTLLESGPRTHVYNLGVNLYPVSQ